MQRPSSPTATIALVGVSTVGVGTLATTDVDLPIEPGCVLPIVCATAAAAAFIRRYTIRQEQRMRALFKAMARQHDERERVLEAREKSLAEREETFQRTQWTTRLRIASAYARVDITREEAAAERERRMQIEGEYRELCREWNEAVLDDAQARLPEEAPRPAIAVGQAGTVHGPRRSYPDRRGPRPYLSVVDGSGERQDSA
ncbi:hypothetical protein DI272_19290 [Streptomyces sp. Act143]|uniref:hypothetical protein n=1 Tax=Streptomyces sp. Act143 TaxID=2200760 RepID=UPI000D672FCB|nr:hypothetical protein [Streptomyces sp. Act143]PWI16075.1 hypothetical protein DI272_19290 [Streptomyces sp. Act143]